jgi:UDP-glucose 4-epimerase
MSRVVLVTGVSADFGRRFARQLVDHRDVSRVIGVDVVPPRGDIGKVSFVRADIRNPVIAKVIVREHVDTVVHMSVMSAPGAAGGRNALKEQNVIGTMQLLAACQQAPELQHLVVKSSASVYGASSRDPAMFTEETGAKRLPSSGYPKDLAEVEAYVRGFARRRPDVRVAMLRNANVIGPTVHSPLTTYFRLPVIPTVMGFDPRLQFLHEHDFHGAFTRATLGDAHGTFNLAGDGVLMLSQVIRRMGRPALPVPPFAVSPVGAALGSAKVVDYSRAQVDFLTYGRGLDTTRMRTELGYEPSFTTETAFADFAAAVGQGVLAADRVRAAETVVAGALSRKADSHG